MSHPYAHFDEGAFPADPGSASDVCQRCQNNCCKKRLPIFLLAGEESLFAGQLVVGDALIQRGEVWEVSMDCCTHLDGDNRCGIYPHRPMDCRMHPIILEFAEEGKLIFRIDITCAQTFLLSEDVLRSRAKYFLREFQNRDVVHDYDAFIKLRLPANKQGVTFIGLEFLLSLRKELGAAGACRECARRGLLSEQEGGRIAAEIAQYRT
uniref:Zinc- or iron-chelating domain-containing protein n=1 Tax=Candidatus Kentrum sp. DK TaxID=2126562 RepID=A0A450S3D9_9GAMM|nr:MAG: Putative zinc- or iron-chelating domain-containing protein [Candidatus Kentron sp. DK]